MPPAPYITARGAFFSPKNENPEAFFILDFSGKSAGKKASKKLGYNEFLQYASENNLYTGPSDVSFYDNRLLFSVSNRDHYYGMYDARTEKLTLHIRLFQDLPNFYGKTGKVENKVIYSYDILWLMEHFEKNPPQTENGKKLQSVCNDPNDNPVLIFCRL